MDSIKAWTTRAWRFSIRFIISLQITVEPLMFILAACNQARGIVTPQLSEDKMKRYYNDSVPPDIHGKDLDKFYNKKMVEWDNNYSYVNLPIACIVGIMYGGYSDFYGRKLPLLVGIASCLVETAMRMLIWSPDTDWSLHWLYPTAIVAGALGDFQLTMSCINAYVTDEFEDKRTLSIRMIVVSIIFSLGSYIASQLTKLMIKHMSHIAVLGIAEGFYAFAIVLGFFMLTTKKPKTNRLIVEDQPEDVYGQSLWAMIKLSFYSLYDSAKIFLMRREGHCRLFLYLCFLANFLDQFVFGEEKNLIGTYTRLPPFKWDSNKYASYKSWRPIVQIVGMFFGMLVFKNLLKIRDTLIICLAIGSMGLSVLIIGLAQKSWEIFASLAPGSLHGLLNPLTYSFMSCIVEQDEVGKAYAISSIAQKLAGLAQTAVLQNIYIATVDWYQGFVWLLMAGIAFFAVFIYAIVHVVAKKENVETVFMHPELLVLSKQREDYTALEQELLKSFSHTEGMGKSTRALKAHAKKRHPASRMLVAVQKRCAQMLNGKINKTTLGSRLSVERAAIFTLLDELCADNAEYFASNLTWTSWGERVLLICNAIRHQGKEIEKLVRELQELAPSFDYDSNTPGNGFRSLVCICDTTVLHIISLLKVIVEQRGSFVFRISHYCKELESYSEVIKFLLEAIPKCISHQTAYSTNSLFPSLDGSYDKYYEMLRNLEQVDSTCFYGRPLGFQFSPSVARIFRFIGIVLASYSLSWEKGHGPFGSLINTGRFFLSPEQRASRIIKVTKEADIQFCKGFWNLSELSNNMPKWFSPAMAINELRTIPQEGPIALETEDGGIVDIPEPSAHTGVRPVQIRVLSPVHREHMSPSSASGQLPASPYLILHCHGGGYVATSSKSHETYLRVWAKLLNCTVISVEYSLAPENPYPRPTEEVLYAYAWILKHPERVGWTGEKVCFVGDSAGGNLVMSVCLRLIQLKVQRRPDGVVPCYTPFLFQYLPSPSRLLSVMDPLLHMGVVLRCVAAYTGGYATKVNEPAENGHKSLQEYVEQVQKAQRIDFTGGPHSIVSLVQNMRGAERKENEQEPAEIPSFFQPEVKKEEEEESDEDNDARSVSSVQIDSDPLHIQLTSTVYDNHLLEYLFRHPTTKNALTVVDENGEIVEDIEEPVPHVEENETKRPRILNLISGNSSTTPNTPSEPVKVISTSASSHNMQSLTHKRSISQSLADTAALAAGHAYDNLAEWLHKPPKEKVKLDRTTSHKEPFEEEELPCEQNPSHIIQLLNNVTVPRDPLISPMYADDALLRQLPPCYFVACHLDPLLDDTIAFAKKLRAAGGQVESVDLLPSVPHGFLNFTLMSPECRKGAKVCIQRIKDALGYVEPV